MKQYKQPTSRSITLQTQNLIAVSVNNKKDADPDVEVWTQHREWWEDIENYWEED